MKKEELHLIIIWEHARDKQDQIISDISGKFSIVGVHEVRWAKDVFGCNLSRFYGEKLPAGSKKEKHCGTGPFVLITFIDKAPRYEFRWTTKGMALVNANVFDAKALYRNWTGGGHRIHGTNSPHETSHDLTLLLGTNPEDYVASHCPSWDGEIKQQQSNLVGTTGWVDIEQLFYVLNATIPYVVLRNFECLPDKYFLEQHGDIDLLVYNANELRLVANATKVHSNSRRVYHTILIGGVAVPFDFRSVGDGYYDRSWQEAILAGRLLSPKGFYRPSPDSYFFSLVYHAVVHKYSMSNDYQERLMRLAEENGIPFLNRHCIEDVIHTKGLIENYMGQHGYIYTEPSDPSVYFNPAIVGNAKTSIFRKVRNRLRKPKQFARQFVERVIRV